MKLFNCVLCYLSVLSIALAVVGCAPGAPTSSAASSEATANAVAETSPIAVIQTPNPAPSQAAPGTVRIVAVPLASFSDLIRVVKPSVVTVNTETVSVNRRNRPSTIQGSGSGWMMDASGTIVTNNHVVEGARTVTVTLSDGRTFTPFSIKTDPATDLAVLKLDAGAFTPLRIADPTRLEVGDWVLSVGNPLGMGVSAKEGIVSRLGVNIEVSPTETYSDLIEISAAINPGNSGGPLFNLSGEVVGISSLKLSTAGVEGMGYAINLKNALPIIQQLAASK